AAQGDYSGVGWTAIRGSEVFNTRLRPMEASAILSRHFDELRMRSGSLSCFLNIALQNELGNAWRYAHEPEKALQIYDDAARLLDDCGEASASDRDMNDRNRAIVLREMGRFDDAVPIFQRLLANSAGANPE